MRVFLTGGNGILGRQLRARCPARIHLLSKSHADLDVTDRRQVFEQIEEAGPDVVIHAAAMTAVDACESESDQAFRINWQGTQNVAEAATAAGAQTLYVSTDYIFDGKKKGEYLEHDPPGPLSVYGRSKWFGEEVVRAVCSRYYIARTQWVFGPGGPNFVETMIRVANEGKPLSVVADQFGCPTYAGHLADALFAILAKDPGTGVYHVSGQGTTSWYGFAGEIFRQTGIEAELSACTTAEFPRPAPRPANGALRNFHLELSIGDPMKPWQHGLRDYLNSDDS